jgi:hypothetical protein
VRYSTHAATAGSRHTALDAARIAPASRTTGQRRLTTTGPATKIRSLGLPPRNRLYLRYDDNLYRFDVKGE